MPSIHTMQVHIPVESTRCFSLNWTGLVHICFEETKRRLNTLQVVAQWTTASFTLPPEGSA